MMKDLNETFLKNVYLLSKKAKRPFCASEALKKSEDVNLESKEKTGSSMCHPNRCATNPNCLRYLGIGDWAEPGIILLLKLN